MRPSLFVPISLVLAALSGAHAEAATPKIEKEWTFLTYLNGFNSLDEFGYLDMNEMEKVGTTDQVNVVVQWASLKKKEVKRILVLKDTDGTNVTSPVLENLGQVDMGDYRTLEDAIRWAAKNYPAKHYFVNIWNHGNGWHFTSGGLSTRDVSYDDLSGHKITTEQLGLAAAEVSKELGQKIDIVGSDSCLMAMAEVVGQMEGSISTFVGSEEVEPADGWPYDQLLAKWNEGGSKSPTEVTSILTKVYVDSYGGHSATLSGVDMAKYPPLVTALRDLAAEIKAQPASVRSKIAMAVRRTQSYTNDDYKDLGDLVDQIGTDTSIRLRVETLSAVKAALKDFVTSNQVSKDYSHSQGVAIWFPDLSWQFGTYKDRYRELTFNKETNWIDAIQSVLSSSLL